MEIIITKHSGVCFGVKRAIQIVSELAEKGNKVYTLGPIIHNPQMVEKLKNSGVEPIDNIEDLDTMNLQGNETVVIRTHGVHPNVLSSIKKRNVSIVDATCPFVRKAQEYAQKLHNEGYLVVVIGEKNHPEVQGIVGFAEDNAIVIYDDKDLPLISTQRIGIVTQTTLSFEHFRYIVCKILELSKEIKIFNTICNATSLRQESTLQVAQKADVMIVVGGKNSANTTRLAKLCEDSGKKTYHIETADEINAEWFNDVNVLGITAGASTPDWIINEVVEKIKIMVGS